MAMLIKGDWIGLIVFLVVCFAIAAFASLATRPEIPTWYAGLRKPSWTPPAWLFGPVWTALYVAMAVAGWLVWHRAGWQGGRLALTLFALQLVLNGAWSFIFFKFHRVGWAFVDIVVLWVAIAATIVTFAAVSQLSSLLLVPYLVWVSYAAALNLTIWRMNE